MALRPRPRRSRPAAIVLCVLLTLPVAVAGAAQAAPGAASRSSSGAGVQGTRPAVAPQSDLLQSIGDLLARLLSGAPAGTPATPPVDAATARALASSVRVSGVGCGLRLTGSGFSVGPDTVVTSAHVVAGLANPVVRRADGATLPAQVQVFDPNRDLAVLAVPGLGVPALALASAVVGETGAIIGHPGGRATAVVSPARVVRKITADVGNIYDTAPSVRRLLVLSSEIEPGDSGAPVVNSTGQVIGVAFAASTTRRATAFAVASEELAPVLAQRRAGAVSTGPCLAA